MKPRLLVLEDNAESRLLLRHLLKGEFEAKLCPNADSAIEAAKSDRFDAALLDINLGERKTGVDVLIELRKLPGHERIPALACTAYALPGDKERFLDAGFQDYVSKPFVKAELIGALNRAVGQR
ncbi:MAG: response regulator [Rhodothermales bacterium]|nr:response regulator [Rhodothermales bacterium]